LDRGRPARQHAAETAAVLSFSGQAHCAGLALFVDIEGGSQTATSSTKAPFFG